MMWTYPCPQGDCPTERVHRPYAKARGKNYKPSFSDFGDRLAGGGDGLVMYGAGEAAQVSYFQADKLAAMSLEDAVQKVRGTVAAMRKTDADLGTECHTAAERFAEGEGWVEPEGLYEYDRERLYQFVGGVARWFEKREPDVLASEFIVADDLYVATGDLITLIDGVPTYVDWKTHRRYKADEKASFPKWWLQAQMLSTAKSLRHYHGGTLVDEVEWDSTDLPRPERGLVVSIGPNGELREYAWPIVPREDIAPLVAALATAISFKAPTPLQAVIPKYEPRPEAPVSVDAMLS